MTEEQLDPVVRESIRKDRWDFDEMSLSFYDWMFDDALGHSIRDEVDDLQKRLGPIRAVNIMGGLTVLRELPVSEGWAVRLKDKRWPHTKLVDNQRNLRVVSGNIRDEKTIARIPNHIHLMLALPQGGKYSLPEDPGFYYHLGDTLLDKVEPGGVALVQLFEPVNTWVHQFVDTHAEIPGIQLTYKPIDSKTHKYPVLMVRKLSPDAKLPLMHI